MNPYKVDLLVDCQRDQVEATREVAQATRDVAAAILRAAGFSGAEALEFYGEVGHTAICCCASGIIKEADNEM